MKEEKLPTATPTGKITKDFNPIKDVEEKVFFHLQDSTHEFTMGLKSILQCLKFAEDENVIPKLPQDFWSAMYGEYHGLYERYSPNFKEGYYNGFWNALDFATNETKKGKKIDDSRFLHLNPDELITELERIEDTDKSKILPLTDFEKNLYNIMKDYFDKAIYMLNRTLDFFISDNFARQLLEEFTRDYAYRNELANYSNLPFILFDNFGNFNMTYRLVKRDSDLWQALSERTDITLVQQNERYDKITPKSNYVFLQGHFYSHTVSNKDDVQSSEKIKFGIIDSPDVSTKRFYQTEYEITDNAFPNLCKIEKYRNNKLLEIAKETMPDL